MKKYVVALLILFLFIPLIGHPSSCGCCSDGCRIGTTYAEVDVAPPVEEDVTDPTVTAFTIPSTATTLEVSISAFTATDDTGVTGYTANESATAPEASAEGWVSTAPTSYTFATAGSKTLYGWAKDAAGNVSTSLSDSVVITLGGDATAPTVTAFTIPSTSETLEVAISTFTATDAVGVTGYTANESATAPDPSAAGWVGTAPTSYTFATAGSKTLYGWAKDAAGNVSTSLSDSVVITLPPSCSNTQTTPDDMETSDYTYSNIGSDSSTKYLSTAFVATADTGTICQVCARLNKVGSPTMNFDVQIWGDSDGLPSTMLTGGDFGTMNAADIAGDFTDCFTEGSVALTNGTKYHVVFIAETTNASNYFRLVEDKTCTTESIAADSDGTSFGIIDTAKCGMVRLYK